MIKIYGRKSCTSTRRAEEWFLQHDISFEFCPISKIPYKEILRILPLTSEGMATLVKNTVKTNSKNKFEVSQLMELTFTDGVNYLKAHHYLLQSPLIVDDEKIMVGFNSEEIRQFTPKLYRNIKLKYNHFL